MAVKKNPLDNQEFDNKELGKVFTALQLLYKEVWQLSDRFENLEKRVNELQLTTIDLLKEYQAIRKFEDKFGK